MFIKKCLLKTQKRLKQLEIIYKIQPTSLYLDIAKYADFRWKHAGTSRKTQRVCHVIHIFFGSSLGKV